MQFRKKHTKYLPFLLLTLFLLLPFLSSGRPFRVNRLPNREFGCGTCHINPAGGGARNSFGKDWEAIAIPQGDEYVPDVAEEDSDGDGFTNDEEFEAGTHPGNSESHPEEVEKKPLTLEQQLIEANNATRKFKDVEVAKASGYVQVSEHVPKMGIHFLNQKLVDEKFEHTAPEVLLYVKQPDGTMKLAGLEYSVPGKTAPEGFTGNEDVWEVHEAACDYVDGTEIKKAQEKDCPEKNPETGAEFASWHPDLQTLHVWLYIKNPDGRFAPFNPAVERTVTAVSPSGKLSFIWGALKAR